MLAFVLPLMILQVGPNPNPESVANIPKTLPEPRAEAAVRRWKADLARPQCPLGDGPLGEGTNAARIAEEAALRTTVTTGADRTAAIHCLAMAQAALEQWSDAADTFARARALVGGDRREQARIGAQRGNALVAAGQYEDAAFAFARARDDAVASGTGALAAVIATDHAAMLVANDDPDSAAQILAAARTDASASPEIWLLSATLARRQGDLVQAEQYIAQALTLADDPAASLEAGVIAALDGRDAEARTRFAEAIEQARTGNIAQQARAYLVQLDPPE